MVQGPHFTKKATSEPVLQTGLPMSPSASVLVLAACLTQFPQFRVTIPMPVCPLLKKECEPLSLVVLIILSCSTLVPHDLANPSAALVAFPELSNAACNAGPVVQSPGPVG